MTFKLEFYEAALDEWRGLDSSLREQLKKKLAERLENPRVPKDAVSGMPHCYKIKARKAGKRLVYEVEDETETLLVLTVGDRDGNDAYDVARTRYDATRQIRTAIKAVKSAARRQGARLLHKNPKKR